MKKEPDGSFFIADFQGKLASMFRPAAFLSLSAALVIVLLMSGGDAVAREMKVQLKSEVPTEAPAPAPAAPAPVKPAAPQVFTCEGKPLNLEVVPSFGHVERDLTLRAVDMTTSKAWGQAMVAHLGGQVKLTAQTAYKIEMDGKSACVLQVETVVLYKLDTKIRIKNTYDSESCEYKQLAAHEQQHIEAAKEFLKQSAPQLKEYLITAMNGQTSFMTTRDDRVRAQIYLEQTMNNRLAEYERFLNAEFVRTQAVGLDTDAQMKQMFAQCPGWKAPEIEVPVTR